MRSFLPFGLLLCACGAFVAASPLPEVEQLLSNLKLRVQQESNTELAVVKKLESWCMNEASIAQVCITAAENNERYQESLARAASAAEDVAKADLDRLLFLTSGKETEAESDASLRQREREAFQQADSDLRVLAQELGDAFVAVSQGASAGTLLQMLSATSYNTTSTLGGFLSEAANGRVPPANLGGALKALVEETVRKSEALQSEEGARQRSYEALEQAKAQELRILASSSDKRKAAIAEQQRIAAQATQKALNAKGLVQQVQLHLADVQVDCQSKGDYWKQHTGIREGELRAMDQVIQVLQSGSPPSPPQLGAPSFLQLRRRPEAPALGRAPRKSQRQDRLLPVDDPETPAGQTEPISFLQRSAESMGESAADDTSSSSASIVAAANSASNSVQVRNEVSWMISRLQSEAKEEQDHSQWCAAERSRSVADRKQRERTRKSLAASIDENAASEAEMAQDIQDLSAILQRMNQVGSEAEAVRQLEHGTTEALLQRYDAASSAIQQAVQTLSESSSEDMRRVAIAQQTGGLLGGGQQSVAQTVIGLLETLASETTRLRSASQAEEVTSQSAFAKYVQSFTAQKAASQGQINELEVAQRKLHTDTLAVQESLAGTTQQVALMDQYLKELEQSCSTQESPEERQNRLQQQVEALNHALSVMGQKTAVE